jgi:hypothetical protein
MRTAASVFVTVCPIAARVSTAIELIERLS